MDLTALLTSAGINSCVCVGLFSLYSVLRKQPNFAGVYFGHRIRRARSNHQDPFWFERLLPSASWLLKAFEASEADLHAAGGLDAVVFLRAVVFSIRVFSVVSTVCLSLVLPVNYYGKNMKHKGISGEKLDVFCIRNVREGSEWLSIHCVALYIITIFSCVLLYIEYKDITKLRLKHISQSTASPSLFTVIVRSIPFRKGESYSDRVFKYFSDIYESTYLSHQMVYDCKAVQKLMVHAEDMYNTLKNNQMEQHNPPRFLQCCYCGGARSSLKIREEETQKIRAQEADTSKKGHKKKGHKLDPSDLSNRECEAALIFFSSRYAALMASESLQTRNPMFWVLDSAPEPQDMFWSNISVVYRLLWMRKIFVKVASGFFVIFFLIPVVFTQSLVHFEKIKSIFPPFTTAANRSVFIFAVALKIIEELVSGYLPSVVFMMFLYIVAPLMMVFSALEGAKSRSGRKRSSCIKVVLFIIWNVFFANILSEAAIDHYQISIEKLGDPKKIPVVLARALPASMTFFMTYTLTSGWASLALELIQPVPVLTSLFYRHILYDGASLGTYTFPYHTEVPRVLLFGLLGFTYSIVAPVILPLLMVYFILAYVVYRNQILNVYMSEYDTGGQYWPIVHNTTIFSLVLTQTICLGFFIIKKAPVVTTFIVPLTVCTLLFHEYCRQQFNPVFQKTPVQTIIEMDRKDDIWGSTEEKHQRLQTAYCQFKTKTLHLHETAIRNYQQRMEMELS